MNQRLRFEVKTMFGVDYYYPLDEYTAHILPLTKASRCLVDFHIKIIQKLGWPIEFNYPDHQE